MRKSAALIVALCVLGTLVICFACGCAPSGRYSLAEAERNPSYAQGPLDDLMVMALYPDDELEVRVVIESALAAQLRAEGVEVEPGFRHFESYDHLEARVAEVADRLADLEIDGIMLFDPIRARHYDPAEYESRRAFYRTMGMDTSTMFAALGQMAAEADASKFVIEIALWNVDIRDFAWHGTWQIKAPGGYDLDYAKAYSAQFAVIIAEKLREEKLIW